MEKEIKKILKKHSSFQDQQNGFRLWSIHQDKWDDIASDIKQLVKESDSLPCVNDRRKLVDFMNFLFENWQPRKHLTAEMLVDGYLKSVSR
jgi:hypothetical protein